VIDEARIRRLKDEAARQLNAGEHYMLVNPTTVIVLCDMALKQPTRLEASCPLCGKSVVWANQSAECHTCKWQGPYPDMR
jgi:predicted RNA-binding Zn-ribbon protein involved in translation (DUF1610 family)